MPPGVNESKSGAFIKSLAAITLHPGGFITLSPGAFIRASTKLSTVLLDCDLLYMDVHDFWFSGKVVRSSSGFVQCYRTVVAFCFKDYVHVRDIS